MMTQQESDRQAFQKLLASHYTLQEKEPSLNKWSAKSFEQMEQIGLPTKKCEPFRALKLRKLFSNPYTFPKSFHTDTFSSYILPECKNSYLLFVNGQFAPLLSKIPTSLIVTPLSEAMHTYGALLQNRWTQWLKTESDPFALCNSALNRKGAFLYLPPKTHLKEPLQILHLTLPSSNPLLILPRFHLFFGKDAKATLLTTHHTSSESALCLNQLTELTLDDGAHVHLTHQLQHKSEKIWHFDALRATLKRESRLETVSFSNGSETVRSDSEILLTKEGGEALLNGLNILGNAREAHTRITIKHLSPHCHSYQLFKNVLSEKSRSSFEGKIFVDPIAQKTDAFQLNNNLILSDRASASSLPNLEIFADDVKASHGSTVGQLDNEQLFYLKTRGFAENSAKQLLLKSFCDEIKAKIPSPSLKSQLSTTLAHLIL